MNGFDWKVIVEWAPLLLQGLGVTILFTLGGLALGLVIGVAVAVMALSRHGLVRIVARAFVDAVRGTPLLLQLFILYYAMPSIGLKLSAPVAGILGLGINAGAYLAEIFRAGIEAVPRQHVHAARSLGMSSRQTFWRIELPQAVGLVLPPMANEMISLVKSTSLISTISIGELLRSGQIAVSITFAPLEIYLVVALLYLAINLALSNLVRVLEHRSGAGARGEAMRSLQDVGV
ncbi:amino acid ABC transporter permease [Siculibacillus lacustris]|uniref:Putative glutamine transport system permease protein GlnP n=1 Tax=Siculibacillus lacustris TaxID=1549641 RepID=A0A4Q9VYW1_9HYPH|nr:amino acid ABC transporter permease [Siculibacillus lacustris]TBW40721.1 amino acid ABC transporter permease [Siculibacillus lacustris]